MKVKEWTDESERINRPMKVMEQRNESEKNRQTNESDGLDKQN